MQLAVALFLIIALAGCGQPPQTVAEATGGPGRNVLIIVADDLGTDKVGAYGEHPDAPQTPNIDALAGRGVLFRNAYAHPYGAATRASIMTGRYARRVGIGDLNLAASLIQLPLVEIALPEMLGESPLDWDTAALGKWNLAGSNSEQFMDHPLAQGFRTHRGAHANLTAMILGAEQERTYEYWEKAIDGVVDISTVYATTDTTDDAIAEVTTMPSPWLAYVAYNAPHVPVHLPPGELKPDWVDEDSEDHVKYDAAIWALDLEIGRLFSEMGPDLLDQTTVIFIADNGSDGDFVRPPLNEGHAKTTSFEGGINVPLIVAGPWVAHPGSESQAIVQDIDIFATVAEIASVNVRELLREDESPAPIDGRSLLPLLRDPSGEIRDFAYTERFRPNGAPPYFGAREIVLTRQYKYVIEDGVGEERLHALEGRTDDGPDLLADPHGLDDTVQIELDLLLEHLRQIRVDVRYAGPGS